MDGKEMSDAPREALEDALPEPPTKWTDQRLGEFFEAYKPAAIRQHVARLEKERDKWKDSHDVARRKASDARIERDARYTRLQVRERLAYAAAVSTSRDGWEADPDERDYEIADQILRMLPAQHEEKNDG
jgi:hypothetical protein